MAAAQRSSTGKKKGFANPVEHWFRTGCGRSSRTACCPATSTMATLLRPGVHPAHRSRRSAGQGAVPRHIYLLRVVRALAPRVHALKPPTGSAMDLSIIIVNWNSRKFLVNCVRSIRRFPPRFRTRLIVIDSGSFDGAETALSAECPEAVFIQCPVNLRIRASEQPGGAERHGELAPAAQPRHGGAARVARRLVPRSQRSA